MPKNEPRIANWKEFLKLIEPFSPTSEKPYGERMAFRGQEKAPSDWNLRPSLARQLPKSCTFEEALGIERLVLQEFIQDGHRNLPSWEIPDLNNPYQLLGWLMVMQQYGAPTRILDWTFSPYVAAYFAVREAPEEDGVLWMHDYPALVKALQAEPKTEVSLSRIDKALAGEVAKPSDPPGICAIFLKAQRSERMYAQQGFYMVCEDPRRAHNEVMNEIAKKASVKPFLHKMVIRSAAKVQFLANLRMMNITGASLSPGVDGLGRHVAEFGKLIASGLARTPVQEPAENSTEGSGQ